MCVCVCGGGGSVCLEVGVNVGADVGVHEDIDVGVDVSDLKSRSIWDRPGVMHLAVSAMFSSEDPPLL